MKFEISIPVLNEEDQLEISIDKISDFRKQNNLDFTVVVADNGSTDRTPEIAQEISKKYEWVSLVRVPKKGVGLALKTAWGQSQADIIGYMDLDLATDINHLKEVISLFKNDECDVCTGSRLIKGAKVVGRKPLRSISSKCFNFWLQLRLNAGFSDGMCGFKFLTRKAYETLRALPYPPSTNSWFFNTELLVKTEWCKLRLTEIPVIWTDDANSKVKLIPLTVRYLKEIERVYNEKTKYVQSKQI